MGFVNAIPGFITIALIVVVTRMMIRLASLFFDAVERGHITLKWLYPDTAPPTRKIVTGLLWLFALVVAYPFLPGSGTDAFKGVSVFVGLIISLGSTGIVNQVMSGLTVTYSRALHVGDYVRVGDVEGTVTHLGTLSTKIQTVLQEEVTIPNAVLISREVTNYSKDAQASTVFVPTSVTIGYDTPWRQIHSLLLLAAERTHGLRRNPVPIVVQAGLEDFYVKYTLFVCLDDPRQRVLNLAALHANIQDVFNEYGVQIMSPHYWTDPQVPKIVPKDHWAPPPAGERPAPGGAGGTR
jgi:small-conductance mechanosensitive channel